MSPALPQALSMALDDELRARATYWAVIQAQGPVAPFVNIVQAEQRHIEALLPLFDRYGIPLPPDRWTGQVAAPATVGLACQAALAGEIRNGRMYEALLARVSEPDVRAVFTNLHYASAYHHLPTFQACAAPYGALPLPMTSAASRDIAPAASRWVLLLGLALGAGVVWWLSGPRTGIGR